MEVQSAPLTVADYCRAFDRDEIQVDRNYQRSDQVWPVAARQFLIETILLGYPIPQFSHHLVTDLKTRSTRRFVVDGQQRTKAIYDFYCGELRLLVGERSSQSTQGRA